MAELTLSVLGTMTAIYCAIIFVITRWRKRQQRFKCQPDAETDVHRVHWCINEGHGASRPLWGDDKAQSPRRKCRLASDGHPGTRKAPVVLQGVQQVLCDHCSKCGGLLPYKVQTLPQDVKPPRGQAKCGYPHKRG